MESIAVFAAILVSAGAFAGLLAGMLGVGGGIILVPVLHGVFQKFGVAEAISMHMAIGTSLMTILPTSIVSARSHHRKGAVDWAGLKYFLPTVIGGVALAAYVADQLRGQVLSLFFGCVALALAARLLLVRQEKAHSGRAENSIRLLSGFVIGFVSSLMGIGGGSFSVPILARLGYGIHRAVGTSSAIGFMIALPGSIGFMLAGADAPGLPPYSLGFVNMMAVACIIPATMLATPWGVHLAHRMAPLMLRRAFGLILAFMALRMLIASV